MCLAAESMTHHPNHHPKGIIMTTQIGQPIVDIQDVSKTFANRTVLEHVTASVACGESLAITGPSGSGKSTLLNMIGLLDEPTTGRICFEGYAYPGMNSAAATRMRRNRINYLFQSYALITDITALDNVLLGLKYAPGSTEDKHDNAVNLLQRLGLGQVINDRVTTLSGGEQQRVALARCMLKPGDLILADEPTGALDPHLAHGMFSQMLQLQRDFGKTLVVVTHDETIAQRCDRRLCLAREASGRTTLEAV